MKLITATIKPMKLEDVCTALTNIGITGLTVTEVQSYDHQHGKDYVFRGTEHAMHFQLKLKIEIPCSDDLVDQVMEAIISAAQTGRIGDGKIFVSDIGQVVRIRTRETGSDAI